MIWFLVILNLLFIGGLSKHAKYFYWASMLLLWFVMSFRDVFVSGWDAEVYKRYFEWFAQPIGSFNIITYDMGETAYKFEVGYVLLNSIVKTIANNYLIFQIIYVSLAFVLLIVIVNDLMLSDKGKCLLLFLYCSQQMVWFFCNLLRQNIAVLIVWYVIEHTFSRRAVLKRGLLLCVACTFHSSAILVMVLYHLLLMVKRIPNKVRFIVAVLLSVLLYLFGSKLNPSLFSMLNGITEGRYQIYHNTTESINIVNYGLRVAIFSLLSLRYQCVDYQKKDAMFNASALCMIVGSINMALFVRAAEYFAIGNYVGMVLNAKTLTSKQYLIFVFLVYAVFMIIFVRFCTTNATFLLSFKWCWE